MTFQSYHTKAPFSIINLQKINGKCLFDVRIKEALLEQPLVDCEAFMRIRSAAAEGASPAIIRSMAPIRPRRSSAAASVFSGTFLSKC